MSDTNIYGHLTQLGGSTPLPNSPQEAVLERVAPASHPTIVRSLMRRLGHRTHADDEAQTARHASARYAADLMTTDVVRARPDDPLAQVIGAMLASD